MSKKMATLVKNTKLTVPKNLSDTILNTISNYTKTGRLSLPKNYNPANALKQAWLIIQETVDKNKKPAIDICTTTSILNALLKMIILGLNPIKTQCYFIIYNNKLTLMTSYFGKQAALKRVEGVEAINANVIYEGDDFKYDIRQTGSIHNIQHTQSFTNINDNKILGAYATITFKGEIFGSISTYQQIQESWKGITGNGKEKTKFRTEFCKRTIISKLVKHFLSTSNDNDLIIETLDEVRINEIETTEKLINEETKVIDINEIETEKLINEETGEIGTSNNDFNFFKNIKDSDKIDA